MDTVRIRGRRLNLQSTEARAAAFRNLFAAADHVHVERGDGLLERPQRAIHPSPRAEQGAAAPLLRAPDGEDDCTARPMALLRGCYVSLGNVEYGDRP